MLIRWTERRIKGVRFSKTILTNSDPTDIIGERLARRSGMSIYLMLTTLTESGRRALQEDPDSLKDINKEVELMGVKILTQYALLGPYDFVNILEAPSNEVVTKLSIRMSAKGTTSTLTLAAMPIDDLIASLKKKDTPW
jgi:uncharacterized protein with GYD domain